MSINQAGKRADHRRPQHSHGNNGPRAPANSQSGCHNCGITGHFAKDCPNNTGRARNNESVPRSNAGSSNTANATSTPDRTGELPAELLDHCQSTFSTQATRSLFEAAKEIEVANDGMLDVHELRPSFVMPRNQEDVLTNRFTMKLPDVLHHYIAVGMEDATVQSFSDKKGKAPQVETAADGTDDDVVKLPSSGQQRVMMAHLINSIDALKFQKHIFTTDKMRHVITWIDPYTLFSVENVDVGDLLGDTTYIVRKANPSKQLDEISKNLKLVYKGKIYVQQLTHAAQGLTAQCSVELSSDRTIAIDQALNMIITKVTLASSPELFRVGANRIYSELDKKPLAPGIFAHHGFSSSIKVGMGAPLLNITSATSAFWEPTSVCRYLAVSKSDYSSLKNLKVEILYTPDEIRTIKAFGKRPRDQMFELGEGENISVLDYLRSKNLDEDFIDQIAMSNYFCADMGTSISHEWYPVEALRIVEHQIVKKLSPEPLRRCSRWQVRCRTIICETLWFAVLLS